VIEFEVRLFKLKKAQECLESDFKKYLNFILLFLRRSELSRAARH
jgi:hypothetical protein